MAVLDYLHWLNLSAVVCVIDHVSIKHALRFVQDYETVRDRRTGSET